MDDTLQNNIPEYVKSLPQDVQDLVFAGVWEDRTSEVAKKYSLNELQTDALINTTLLVLIGLEKPDTFLQAVTADLGISTLIAEQIMEDLEKRVFEYALSQLKNSESAKPVSETNRPGNTMPEIRPTMAPMVEKVEPMRAPVPRYIPPTFNGGEKVQQPVSVPRFTSAPGAQTPGIPSPAPAPTNPGQNPMDNKLNNVVKGPDSTPPPVQKPPERYTSDPYREPLN